MTKIRFSNGHEISSCEEKLCDVYETPDQKKKLPYEAYDGLPIRCDNTWGKFDFFAAVTLNGLIGGRAPATLYGKLWERRREIGESLEKISPEYDLADPKLPWDKLKEELRSLFDIFTSVSGIKEAITTKILHKKREKLIPIIDSKIIEVLDLFTLLGEKRSASRKYKSPSEKATETVIEYTELIRKGLLKYTEEIEKIKRNIEQRYSLSKVRIFEALLWYNAEKLK